MRFPRCPTISLSSIFMTKFLKNDTEAQLASPADSFRLKVARVASINDYDLVMLVQEALNSRLGRPSDVTPEPSTVAGPPEGIALAVFLGKHQQDLRRPESRDILVSICCYYCDNRISMLVGLLNIYYSDRTFSRAADFQEPDFSCNIHHWHQGYRHSWQQLRAIQSLNTSFLKVDYF